MQLLRPAHRDGGGLDFLERAQVLGDIALQGEHPDDRCRHDSSRHNPVKTPKPLLFFPLPLASLVE